MKKQSLASLLICLGLLVSLLPLGGPGSSSDREVYAQGPRNVDIVFVMDTSGSMDDEFSALCGSIPDIADNLLALGIGVRYEILGITQTQECAGATVYESVPSPTVDDLEDWGPAVRDIAVGYAWEPSATRLIIPMSDEAPENGNSCNVPGPDEEAINQAIAAANANRVRVAPILCSGHEACEADLAQRLADETGGYVFYSFTPADDLAAGIEELIGTVAADRDGDGIADDDDPAPDDPCQPDPQAICLPRQICGVSNTPHWDDDWDGATDEELPNLADDDGDGLIDEDLGGPNCPYPEQDCGVNSHRGFDDDNDGKVDEEVDNGFDDDGDSYVDEDVACPCPPEQDLGVNDTPGIDDDHDFATDEEKDDGLDDDGDGCVDEDIASQSGPDFAIIYVSIEPAHPKEMEVSRIIYNIQNIGDPYTPQSGKFEIVLTARDQDSPDYWRYTYSGCLTRDPLRRGIDFEVDPFLFLYARTYQVEVKFKSLDITEQNTSNNSQVSRIVEVSSDPIDLAPCGRLLIDIAIVAAETLIGPGSSAHAETAIELAEIAEHLINMLALGSSCKRDEENLTDEQVIECQLEMIDILMDQMIKELANLFVEHNLANNVENFLSKFGAKLIAHFVLGLKHAVQCGWHLGDVLIRVVQNIKNHGTDMNAVLIESPVNAIVTNSRGQRLGILPDGSIVNEIENAEVLVRDDVKIIVYPGTDTASLTMNGTNAGAFDLTMALSESGTEELRIAKYEDVSVAAATAGEVDIEGELSLRLDDDGDGIIDRQVSPVIPSDEHTDPTADGGSGAGIALVVLLLGVGVMALVVVSTRRRRQPAIAPGAPTGSAGARLVIVRGANAGGMVPLGTSDLTIGRSQAANLPLAHTGVSRRHAVIRYAQGRWFLQDQGSTHGTYVNGQRVEATALHPGDRITIGDTELEFRVG